MRKIALGLGVAASAIAAPAMARDGQVYFGADTGVVFAEDIRHGCQRLSKMALSSTTRSAGNSTAQLGYDSGPVRTEVEVGYREFDPEQSRCSGRRRARRTEYAATLHACVLGSNFAAAGETRLTTVMANALLDFGGDDGIGFSVGGGFGHAWMGSLMSIASTGPGFLRLRRDHLQEACTITNGPGRALPRCAFRRASISTSV